MKVLFSLGLAFLLAFGAPSLRLASNHSELSKACVLSVQSLRQSAKELKASLKGLHGTKLLRTKVLLWANNKKLTFINTLFSTLLMQKAYKGRAFDLVALASLNLDAMKKYLYEKDGKWYVKNNQFAKDMDFIFQLLVRKKRLDDAYTSSMQRLRMKLGITKANALLKEHKEELELRIQVALKMLEKKA